MITLRVFLLLLQAICFFNILTSLPSILTSGLISVGRTIISAPASATEYSHALRTEFAGLEQLVQDTALLSPLSHDLVIGYIAIEDLLKVVRSSYLDGGDVLVEHLEALREDAKATAYDLQALQVKVDGVIDRVFAVSQVLTKALEQRSSASTITSMTCAVIGDVPLISSPCTYLRHLPMLFQEFLDSFESAIVALITRTHVLAEDLQRMEGRLSTIRDVSSGEVKVRLAEKAELLADLWTWFGGNKRHLAMLDRSLQSLRMLYEYHGLADRCVASAQAELRGMREALEGLRPLVSDALVLESDFSIEAIVEQIRLGGERVRQRQREISNHRMADGTRRPVLLSSTVFDD